MPGPPVAVCEGDLLSVEVNNHLHTETTTVHFHGKYLSINLNLKLLNNGGQRNHLPSLKSVTTPINRLL